MRANFYTERLFYSVVPISITEDGLIASKSNALAMIFIKHQLMLTDLKVNLPVILKVDLREYSIL